MSKNALSSRNDGFPAGLRVLVVDDDLTWLKILEKMLKKCSYEVTTCGLAREALNLLREKKDGYDIVISDVNMPDMDGFKLLEHVGLEMDLPVIMMSVDGETRRVMKGVQHGACDYLLKPIRMKELRNIWQHVFRKRMRESREFWGLNGFEGFQLMRNGADQYDEGSLFAIEDMSSTKKRKNPDSKRDSKEFGDQSNKKARVVWTVDLHQKFVKAVNHLGFDKVGPKKILDLMNVPWLTRDNVASHLQKYRQYLSRLQENSSSSAIQNSGSSSVIQKSDLISKDPAAAAAASFSFQNPIKNNRQHQQNDVSIDNAAAAAAKSHESNSNDNHLKGIISDTAMDKRPDFSSNIHDSSTRTNTNQSGFEWNEFPEMQHRKHKQYLPMKDGFSHSPLNGTEHLFQGAIDQSQAETSIRSSRSIMEAETTSCIETTLYAATDYTSDYACSDTSIGSAGGGVSLQSKNLMGGNDKSLEPGSTSDFGRKTEGFHLDSVSDMDFHQLNMLLESEFTSFPANPASEEDLKSMWLQGERYQNSGMQNIGMPDYYFDQGLTGEIPFNLFDTTAEYSAVEKGLSIV